MTTTKPEPASALSMSKFASKADYDAAKAAQDERAAFESCHELRHHDFEKTRNGDYFSHSVGVAWLAFQAGAQWQAAIEQSRRAAPSDLHDAIMALPCVPYAAGTETAYSNMHSIGFRLGHETAKKTAAQLALTASSHAEETARDWSEDFAHENGNYQNICSACKNTFMGHKRRFTCKACASSHAGEVRGAVGVPDYDDGITLADLIDAPQLYAQVYIAARVINDWPNAVALEVAGQAAKDYGNAPCKTVPELESVLREVLRTDGETANQMEQNK